MADYTAPITTAFELQRASIEQGQSALEQGVQFQQHMSQAMLGSFESQESVQRRSVELSQTAIHTYLDTLESSVPGVEPAVEELRSTVDEQFEFLLENHAETFDAVEEELSEGVEAYDELSADSLDALDEQLTMLIEAHEDVEAQSVDVVEDMADQVEDLQQQVEEVQEQVQDVQEQAAQAVEA
ncbi:hypothetical protein [Halorhabdus salina]|uniref:hypothetical protein n=1 Tax=Halorhabdus salina TaxID=2750670 RepID=UPI0015EFB733|nr:hypothetical protein [Halorhabdus salina]